jgi:c-di-GMP-binding flagellar brake protein YcgR
MEDRRQFYRISDLLVLNYKVVQPEALTDAAHRIERGRMDRNNVHSLLLFMDSRLQGIIGKIGQDDPAVAEALDLLNKKIGLLERMLNATSEYGAKHEELEHEQTQEVNISAGGLAFKARNPLAEGAHLELELALSPAYRFIRCYGRVVSCRTCEDRSELFNIAVEFEYIDDDDREFLVQHIFKRQSEDLRKQREERQAG